MKTGYSNYICWLFAKNPIRKANTVQIIYDGYLQKSNKKIKYKKPNYTSFLFERDPNKKVSKRYIIVNEKMTSFHY